MDSRSNNQWIWGWAWLFVFVVFIVLFVAERFGQTDARIERLESQVKSLTSK